MDSHLNAAIRLEENEKKEYEQNATLIRGETQKLVQQYNANTTVITRTAEAEAFAKVESAKARYEEIIGQARGVGIAEVIDGLGMEEFGENVTDTFLKLMAILDNNATQIVNIETPAMIKLGGSM